MNSDNANTNTHEQQSSRKSRASSSDPFLNPKKNMDEGASETTRRIGGRGAAPSLGPLPTTTTAFGSPSMTMPSKFGASINTVQMKTKGGPNAATTTTIYVWELSQAPILPEFHALERTAVFVPKATPAVVAARISTHLRARSIQAVYDDEKAKVKCLTTEGVDFRIRLYRGRHQYSHGIIVEVQRRFGFSMGFHSDAQAILDVAQGKASASLPAAPSRVLPQVSDDEDEDEDYSAPPAPTGSSSLAMVEKMLSLPGFDAQYLGLQTLSSLVDPERMSMQTARRTAVALLKGDSQVGEKVLAFIINRKADDDTYAGLRILALGILANAMRAAATVPDALRSTLRPVLLQDLVHAEENTNTALVAAKCMEYFVRGDHDSIELHQAFESARKIGEARHVALMDQAERCLLSIR